MNEIPKGDDLRALIDQARVRLSAEVQGVINEALESVEDSEVTTLDGPQGDAAKALAAELAAVKAQEAAFKARGDALTKALKVISGEAHAVSVGKERLYTLSRTTPTRVNTKLVQEMFPPSDYPALYLEGKEEVRLTLNKEFRAAAIEAASRPEIEK